MQRMLELIRYYDRDKSQHAPLSESLSSKLLQLMDVFGSLPATSTGHVIVQTAKVKWGSSKPGTMLRMLAQLRAVLRVAARDGLIPAVPHLTMPQVYDVVDCPITPSEGRLLLAHMKWTSPTWYPLALVLMHTGVRLSEALRLQPGDFAGGSVRVSKPAAGRTKTIVRHIPMSRDMAAANVSGIFLNGFVNLAQGNAQATCQPPSKGPVASYSSARSVAACLGRAIKCACQSLGLPEVRVHDLRHVFAAAIAEAGGDLADIATLLGHSNLKTTLRYRGLVKQRAKQLVENL